LLDERIPDAVVADERSCLVAGRQGLGERGEELLREARGVGVEGVPGARIALGADAGERSDGCLVAGLAIDEQAASGVARVGRVGRVAATHQLHVEAEFVDDAPGQQAHEVGVSREPRVDALEGVRRDRSAAEVAVAFEQQHIEAGAGEVGGGSEAVVAAADDDDVTVFALVALLAVLGHPQSVSGAAPESRATAFQNAETRDSGAATGAAAHLSARGAWRARRRGCRPHTSPPLR
jgi:hypothetical protein